MRNSDAGNILWEWAFTTIELVTQSDEVMQYAYDFSHPKPVVQIGRDEDTEAFSLSDFTVQAGSATALPTVSFTLLGSVHCDLADAIEDPKADISSVSLFVPGSASVANTTMDEVSVEAQAEESGDVVPIEEYLPYPVTDMEQRSTGHTFVGRFTQKVTLEIDSGTVSLMVEARNAIGNYGYDSIDLAFDLTTDDEGNLIDATLLSVEQNESTERGLFQPLWGKIKDSSLRTEDIDDARVELRTSSQDIQTIDIVEHPQTGHHYTKTPVIALAKPFVDDSIDAPNVIQIFDNRLSTQLAYYSPREATKTTQGGFNAANASSKTQMNWGFTAASPPNVQTYAEGTMVSINWYSEVFDKPDVEIIEATVLRRDHARLGLIPRAWQKATKVSLIGDPTGGSTLRPQTGTRLKGKRFVVDVGIGAKAMPEKLIEVVYRYTNEEGETDYALTQVANFKVDTLKTIVLAVDGLAYDSALEPLAHTQSGKPGTFALMFPPDKTMGLKGGSEIALSALPTITWANWPGVFGGGSPSEHGVTGNSFFQRELVDAIPVYSGGASGLLGKYASVTQLLPVASFGSMNGLASEDAGSLYDQIAEGMGKTGGDKERLSAISVRPFYSKASADTAHVKRINFPLDPRLHGHDWETAEKLDDGFPDKDPWVYPRDAYLGFNGREFDLLKNSTGSGPVAAAHWVAANKTELDVMSIYLPGPDNVGHGIGQVTETSTTPGNNSEAVPHETTEGFVGFDVTRPVNSMAIHAKHVTDRAMSRLWTKIQEDGYSNAVMFAMMADHGQHQYMGFDHTAESDVIDEHNNLVKDRYNIYTQDIKELMEEPPQLGGLGMSVWTREFVYNIRNKNIVYSGNGGLGQFYIRSEGSSWPDAPTADDVLRVANYLNLLNENELDDDRLPFDPKFHPKRNTNGDLITDGVFGSPAAIFARIRKTDDGTMESGFHVPYHWVKINYVKDATGKIVVDSSGYSASIDSVEFLSLDSFLEKREALLEGRRDLIRLGGAFHWPAFRERMEELNSVRSGDIVVISDGREGYLLLNTEADSYRGWHGGPTVSESFVPLLISMPGEAFENSAGPVVIPPRFAQGYEARPAAIGGYARNYQLGDVLKIVHGEFQK